MIRPIPVYRKGDQHPDIYFVQRRLLCPEVTSRFDSETESRVRGFQQAHGLPITGELDEETLGLLLIRSDQ